MKADPTAPPASTWNTRSGIVRAAMNASYSRPVPNCWASTTDRTSPSRRLATKPTITISEASASLRVCRYIAESLPGSAANGPEPAGPRHHRLVGALLQPIVEGGEGGVLAVAPAERLPDQVVGEPGILRQERAVEVAAVGVAVDGALGAVLPVVAVALEHPPERPAARPEVGLAAVVLEADQCPPRAVQVRLDDDVADVPARPRHRAHVEDADAGELLAVHGGVGVPEELIAAADGEHHRPRLDGFLDGLALLGQEVRRDHSLFTVLAAPEEDKVACSRVETVAKAHRLHLQLDAAPGAAPLEGQDIPSVAVDVHQVGIEGGEREPKRCQRALLSPA